MYERAVEGWQALADMLGVNIRTIQRRKLELESSGVIFYMAKGRRKQKIMMFFPSTVRAFIMKKTQLGESL